MKEIRYTLITDGSSDQALLSILSWLLIDLGVRLAIQPLWADFRRLRYPPKKLSEKIQKAIDLYPCDLLFIHRDAEKESRQNRIEEIHIAISTLNQAMALPVICVVPIRMTEAWLLLDEVAIRTAAGNPNGMQTLNLPKASKIELLSDPKETLRELLTTARPSARTKLPPITRVAELTESFHLLRHLSAFQALESDLKEVLKDQGWLIF